jgi:hypothetical protein
MQRLWSKNATGIAPDGRWYAGDVNALQDAVAGISDFAQFIDLGGIRIGESGLQLLRYGAGEARLSGAFRTDGIVRALGGLYLGAFTTTQRDAIPAGFRPYGIVILNTTANRLEINLGTDPTPNWKAVGVDPAASADFYPQAVNNYFISSRRSGDNNPRFRIREDGREEWGDGTNALDTFLTRLAAGVLTINGQAIVLANDSRLTPGWKTFVVGPVKVGGVGYVTDTLTPIFDIIVPGGTIPTDGSGMLEVFIDADYAQNFGGATDPSIRTAISYGGVMLWDSKEGQNSLVQTTDLRPVDWKFRLVQRGANNLLSMKGNFEMGAAGNLPGRPAGIGRNRSDTHAGSFGTDAPKPIDTTVAQHLVVSIAHNVSTANLYFTMHHALARCLR